MSIDWKSSANSIAESIARANQKLMQDKGIPYTPPANQGMTAEQASNQPTYSGAQNMVGSTTGSSNVLGTLSQIGQTQAQKSSNGSFNGWTDTKTGNVYDTSGMTPQQAYALQLNKQGNTNAESILRNMGYDINGNAFVPTSQAKPPATSSPLGSVAPTGTTTQTASTVTPGVRFNPDADPSARLAEFKSNPQSAQNEINIVKQMYEQEKASGASPERLAQIHDWANQVRSVSGIPDDNVTPASGTPATGDGATSATGGTAEDAIRAKFKAMADAKVQSDKAVFDQQAADAKTKLEKIYADAVASGEMSKREADAALASEKAQIDKQNYQNGEDRNVVADQRGIGNSQQLLGMQATDNALANTATNSATASRDKALADIQTRMANLLTNKQLDMQQVDNTYNSNINKSQADATAQFNEQSANFDVGNYQFDKQQAAAKEATASDREFELAKMALGQKYNLEGMDKQSVLRLAEMEKGNGYDVDKIGLQFDNELKKLNLTQGFDKEMAGLDMTNKVKLMKLDQAGQLENIKAKLKAESDSTEADYQTVRSRELAKYTPGTPEYTIRMNQLDDARSAQKQDILNKVITEADAQALIKDPNFHGTSAPTPVTPRTNPTMSDIVGNFWNSLNPFGSIHKPGTPYNQSELDKNNAEVKSYQRYLDMVGK